MRHSVRKFWGAALIATAAAFVLAPAMAGAQTTTTTLIPGAGIGSCNYAVAPTTVAPGGQVTISGSAPGGVTVQLFVNGATTPTQQQVLGGDSSTLVPFSFTVNAPATPGDMSVTVNYVYNGTGEAAGNSYVASCIGTAGEVVTRVKVEVAGEQVVKAPLAFTGSNDTPTFVIIGAAAVVIGLVLVVAARRRSRVHG